MDEIRRFTRIIPEATSSLSVPAADSILALLLHMDGTNTSTSFPDSGGRNHVVTPNGNVQVSTADFVFGGASALFDGVGDYLTLDGSYDFAFGIGDFDVDFRFKHIAEADIDTLIDFGYSSGNFKISILADDSLTFHVGSTFRNTASSTIVTDTWYHCAVTRKNGITRLFLDGTQAASNFTDNHDYTAGANLPIIGAADSFAEFLNGRIDELRIINGYAPWSSNFTLPTGPYPP